MKTWEVDLYHDGKSAISSYIVRAQTVTDALHTACASLGRGAEIYRVLIRLKTNKFLEVVYADEYSREVDL